MRKLEKLCFLLPLILFLNCNNSPPRVLGNGIIISQERTVPDFSELYLEGSYVVFIDSSSSDIIEIEGEENILPHIRTEKSGSMFKIYPDRSVSCTVPIKVFMKNENLTGIKIKGTSRIDCKKAEGKVLDVDITGEGQMDLSGNVKRLNIDIDGTGNINAKKLDADSTRIGIDGMGILTVNANKYLNVKIKGMGNITYYGDPEIVQKIEGIGSITSGD